ncbi:MAG: hypothetical protein AMXMBFR7_16160 [Planctomycetota bacterium]
MIGVRPVHVNGIPGRIRTSDLNLRRQGQASNPNHSLHAYPYLERLLHRIKNPWPSSEQPLINLKSGTVFGHFPDLAELAELWPSLTRADRAEILRRAHDLAGEKREAPPPPLN